MRNHTPAPETCEDRGYDCCDKLTRREHFATYGYVCAGDADPSTEELKAWEGNAP